MVSRFFANEQLHSITNFCIPSQQSRNDHLRGSPTSTAGGCLLYAYRDCTISIGFAQKYKIKATRERERNHKIYMNYRAPPQLPYILSIIFSSDTMSTTTWLHPVIQTWLVGGVGGDHRAATTSDRIYLQITFEPRATLLVTNDYILFIPKVEERQGMCRLHRIRSSHIAPQNIYIYILLGLCGGSFGFTS